MDKILELFGFPNKVRLSTKVTKKVVLENNQLTTSEKKLIKEEINDIIWLAVIKPSTYNVPIYLDENYIFDEITFIVVKISNKNKAKKISELFQKIIPYQLIVIVNYEDEILLNVADKRINKNDKERRTVEKLLFTDWFKYEEIADNENINSFFTSLNITNLPHRNLKAFYTGIINRVNCYEISKRTNKFKILEDDKIYEVLYMISGLESKEEMIKSMRNKLKNETQFNVQFQLSQNIKAIQKEINEIIETINKY